VTSAPLPRWRPLIAVVTGPTATIVNTPPIGADPNALHPQRLASPLTAEAEPASVHPLASPSAAEGAGDNASPLRMLGAGSLLPLPHPEPLAGDAQTFFPSAERLYEEIDCFDLDENGRSRVLSRRADFEFFRAGPPAGYDDEGEIAGVDYFPYGDTPRRAEPDFSALLRITNTVQSIADGRVDAIQWLEGTPVIEETLYWLSLLIDTDKPIVGQVAQRMHRTIGSDGPKNLLDGVTYIASKAWQADGPPENGGDAVGPVLVTDGLVFTAREVVKTAGRPGGYTAAGFGPVAAITSEERQRVEFLPTRRHTGRSEVRTSALPETVEGLRGRVAVRKAGGELLTGILAAVEIVKYGRYGLGGDSSLDGFLIRERTRLSRERHDLAGFVLEGLAQNGWATIELERELRTAHYSGLPVVWTGRGIPAAPAGLPPAPFISADGLSSTKARILLLAAMLRHGSAPVAADPAEPTDAERTATLEHTRLLQHLFDTH
jgi:L-asparaginase/Glu-tRNA(Gln) amidotransferase subunit D